MKKPKSAPEQFVQKVFDEYDQRIAKEMKAMEETRPFNPDCDVDECGITNGDRAERAERAVIEWLGTDGKDDTYRTHIQDLLCDLMHLCDRDRLDFNSILDMARRCQEDER